MYNDDIDGITGNPYLQQLVTTDFNKALTYFKSVTLQSKFIEIKNGEHTTIIMLSSMLNNIQTMKKGQKNVLWILRWINVKLTKNYTEQILMVGKLENMLTIIVIP
jgi:hypothetical protein